MSFKKSVCSFAPSTQRQMPLEVEEGTYSALTIVIRECGHFQEEVLGFGIGAISLFILLSSNISAPQQLGKDEMPILFYSQDTRNCILLSKFCLLLLVADIRGGTYS